MNKNRAAEIRADEIERSLLGVRAEVWWSPADRAYVAFSVDYPDLICSDPWSSLAAINKLEDRIRRTLVAEATRTAA
ncbi:hypothetical protein [Nocardia mexicana]|uniref:Uncharacterized protein n=1 Tax=Nocardia mexicana TaxID=279262 RepID=A0A370GIY5_9NOCA|nr:hypothetical protein [Nocardia mexicana]RDI43330.1 hypothetical protein DFR68_12293 [Nocardia mexicana]